MIFTLTMNLDNAEAAESGPDAVADYVANVSRRIRAGHGSGKILDGNGNTIGEYGITESAG